MSKIMPLANDHITLWESPDPENCFSGSPGICRLDSGRLVATFDARGSGAGKLPGPKHEGRPGYFLQGMIMTSDDGGETWQQRGYFPFLHARPFTAGGKVYILGHAGDLMIVASDDEGQTWSETTALSESQHWHQAPCNVHYANDCVYLVMERRVEPPQCKAWAVSEMAPVLMRAKAKDDLCQRESWTLANEKYFCKSVPDKDLQWHGIPFFPAEYPEAFAASPGRQCAPIGWLETNVVQFTDPDHFWYDPNGRTFHLWARAHTGGVGYAAIAKVIEKKDGSMETMFETAPSGKTMLYVPCPGGQMKFHILYDEQTKLFWLLSTQAVDSMTRAECLPDDRYNLPNNERRRLVLHFSRNCIDWVFAGLVAAGPVEKASRHYASMAIDGDDLAILSRSGDEEALHPHDGNLITFHRVKDFRALVY